jgi:hypothetical protein
VNGWSIDANSDNFKVREECVNMLDVDILGVAETHLQGNQNLTLPGYVWIGQNRTQLHVNARTGSGGVGVFVKDHLYEQFYVKILDATCEGILWVSFVHKSYLAYEFMVCVCYLPPENSTRYVNVNDFFDSLLTGIYEFQNRGDYFLIGDFNSRIGDLDDFIAGIDEVPSRSVIDYKRNAHGDNFVRFLIDTNCCVLNGRNAVSNDYTCISVKGVSVVDYCIVPHESLYRYDKSEVITASDLIHACFPGGVESRLIPDHSALRFVFSPGCDMLDESGYEATVSTQFKKFDVSDVPLDFCTDVDTQLKLNNIISELENSQKRQQDVDSVYTSLCNVIKGEMEARLPHKTVTLRSRSGSNKKKKFGKPWWNERLSVMWNDVCVAEKRWLRCKMGEKRRLKHEFVTIRKTFDKHVQSCKRKHWFKIQNGLVEYVDSSPEFWRTKLERLVCVMAVKK